MKSESPCKLLIAIAAINSYLPPIDAAISKTAVPIASETSPDSSMYRNYLQELITTSQSPHDQKHTKEYYKDHSKDHSKISS